MLTDERNQNKDLVRKVQEKQEISFHDRVFKVTKAFAEHLVAIRIDSTDVLLDAYLRSQQVYVNRLK